MRLKFAIGAVGTFLFLGIIFFSQSSAHEPASINDQLLSSERLQELAQRTNIGIVREDVEHIAIVRVPDTPAIRQVRDYIIAEISQHPSWTFEIQEFHSETPLGTKQFENIIATWNPGARQSKKWHDPENEKRVVLAAHYDSKLFPFEFVAASDSAVPCALLLDIIRTLDKEFSEFGQNSAKIHPQLSLQIVFFDGEEAFREWTDTDSLYGSRYLAEHWEKRDLSREGNRKAEGLSNIDVFILLDLIGSNDPIPEFRSLFSQTNNIFAQFVQLESALIQFGLYDTSNLPSTRLDAGNGYFTSASAGFYAVTDDHIPFLKRNVPIVHMIPTRFPKSWHKQADNLQTVDWIQVENLSTLLRCWVAQYFNFQ